MSGQLISIYKRELKTYFNSGFGSVILMIYLLLSMLAVFYLGNFFDVVNTDLFSFFYFQPYIFLIITPALTMKQWAEERKSGSIEFILTQPVSLTNIVCAKFFAAWSFAGILLISTFPFWIYMNVEFTLDNQNIIIAYIGCILMTGMLCALGCMISSFNTSPITSYILTLFICWGIITINYSPIIRTLPIDGGIISKITTSLNFDKHFQDMIMGQISLDNFIYFVSSIVVALWLNTISIEYKKA